MKIVRRPDKPVRIEMLPLIDIVFLLLIFFIYAMLSMAVHRGLDLDLPESAVTTISDQSTWAISIKRRNTATDIYLEEQRIQLDDLTKILADQPDERKVQPVLLFADVRGLLSTAFHGSGRTAAGGLSGYIPAGQSAMIDTRLSLAFVTALFVHLAVLALPLHTQLPEVTMPGAAAVSIRVGEIFQRPEQAVADQKPQPVAEAPRSPIQHRLWRPSPW